MPTDWNVIDIAESYESYVPIRERVLAYPLMFPAIGLGRPDCQVVLDYGCGTGRVAERITAACDATVIAADVSAAMLGIARRKRPDPRVRYVQIGDDQRLELSDGSMDAALTCFVLVVIPERDRIQRIFDEVNRVLRPGASYAILDVNPNTYGTPFALARIGEAGRGYGPGDPVDVRLTAPDGEDLVLVDYCWPVRTVCDMLSAAGFRSTDVHEPTLPTTYDGPDTALMLVERTHPPYVIYVAHR